MFNVREAIAQKKELVISHYQYLHQHPELSFKEFNTTAYIREQLEKLGNYTITTPTETGLIAEIKSPNPGKLIALRADIDCLPMTEATNLTYASKTEGCMHACGHDAHTAMLLGVAAVISENIKELNGTFRLLFQPAEELPPGGAEEFIKAGVLEGVDYILGQHVMPTLPTGQIGLRKGPMMAASDRFTITIKGSGGHASLPHSAIDPIAIGAQVITNLQQIVSRETDPLDNLVISTTNFHSGGNAYNVIPDDAILRGSVRSYRDDTRHYAAKRIQEVATGIAQVHRANIECEYVFGYDATVNNIEVATCLQEVITTHFGDAALPAIEPLMGAEDFSRYLRVVPGAFYFLGIGNESKGLTAPIHNSCFQVDTDALPIGMEVMLRGAMELSKK